MHEHVRFALERALLDMENSIAWLDNDIQEARETLLLSEVALMQMQGKAQALRDALSEED